MRINDFISMYHKLEEDKGQVRPVVGLALELAITYGRKFTPEYSVEDVLDNWDATHLFMIRNYISDGPGYTGDVVYQIWGGGPEYVTVYMFDRETMTWNISNHGDTCGQ